MKIRTGFVTNSSSSSYCAVRISSSKLADILKKYKRLFDEPCNGGYDNPVTDYGFDFGDQRSQWNYTGPADKENMASNFVDFVRCYFVDDLEGGLDDGIVPEIMGLIEELEKNTEEINDSISSLEVKIIDSEWGECKEILRNLSDDCIRLYMDLEEDEELTPEIREEFMRSVATLDAELTTKWSYDGRELKLTEHMCLE